MPKKYFRRKDKFLAVQWSEERYEEIRKLTKGRVFYDFVDDAFVLYSHGNDVILKHGDYIVKDKDEYDVWSEDVFEALFEVVPGQDDKIGGENNE